jgi:nucleoside permease NupC
MANNHIMLGIMLAISAFIVIITIITPLKEQVTIARDADHLNCTSTDIDVGTRATCTLTGFYVFLFVGTVLAGSLTLISIGKKKRDASK